MPRLVLASRSPRRRALLAALTEPLEVRPTAVPADVDERPRPGEAPAELVTRLARTKAAVVHRAGTMTLAGDTVVAVAGRVLGQPDDRDDARRMLAAVRGSTVEVLSRIELLDADGRANGLTVVSELRLRRYRDDEVDAYLATGEADDKAGALAVQGSAATLTERVEGCWSNVVGLPTCAASRLLRTAGLPLPDAEPCRGIDCLPATADATLRPDGRLRARPV